MDVTNVLDKQYGNEDIGKLRNKKEKKRKKRVIKGFKVKYMLQLSSNVVKTVFLNIHGNQYDLYVEKIPFFGKMLLLGHFAQTFCSRSNCSMVGFHINFK